MGGNGNGSGTVIELGMQRYDQPAEPRPVPHGLVLRRWRTAAAVLAGLLVLSAGGAAPFPGPPVREVHSLPAAAAGPYRLVDDLLAVIEPRHEVNRRGDPITGYDPGDGRRLWSTELDTARPGIDAAPTAGVLLVQEEVGEPAGARTTALDLRTGRRRWSLPYWLATSQEESTGLIVDQVFAPESRYIPGAGGTPREIYRARDGHVYTSPPVGLIVRALDFDTGRLRWESPRLETAVPVPGAGGQSPAVLTMPAGGVVVEVRDAATGTLRHRLDWPGGEPTSAARVGDVVAVSRSGSDPGVTAYSADLRQLRWSRSLAGPNPFVEPCGPMLCQPDTAGTVALDPATGAARWRLGEQVRLVAAGSWLVELDNDGRLRRILDPLTGRVVGDLAGWRPADTDIQRGADQITGGPPPLLLRPDQVTQRTEIGLFDPTGPSVRRLGVLPYILRECQVAGRFLACRTADGRLRVWRRR